LKAYRLRVTTSNLGAVEAAFWMSTPSTMVELSPTPLSTVAEVSPQMATREDHGSVRRLEVRVVHDGTRIAVRLAWRMPEPHVIGDLNQFADAVAVMFPMHSEASAMTMGAKDRPVNAWYWRAGDEAPFDVLAEGLGTSQRREASSTGLSAHSRHADGSWTVVLVRSLAVEAPAARFGPGMRSGIAFSVWDGGNAERAAYKSSSLAFAELEVDA
jgi:ethylbenzene hydroxylase subunit gamma/complex iron-sulfur molybdoenzyme family reductase subunit gamma